jgi:hypothetical protein
MSANPLPYRERGWAVAGLQGGFARQVRRCRFGRRRSWNLYLSRNGKGGEPRRAGEGAEPERATEPGATKETTIDDAGMTSGAPFA